MEAPPRLAPHVAFPAYAFVPGQTPHPFSHPAGHHHAPFGEVLAAPDPESWRECLPYLHALDLFNHGFYWEAHEVWEGLWHACGRRGPTADFLKGLIHLAAAGVKVRQGLEAGVISHAQKAARAFARCAEALAATKHMGLNFDRLQAHAQSLSKQAPAFLCENTPPRLPLLLWPNDG